MTSCAGEPSRHPGCAASDQEKQRGKSYLNVTSRRQWIDKTNRKNKVTSTRFKNNIYNSIRQKRSRPPGVQIKNHTEMARSSALVRYWKLPVFHGSKLSLFLKTRRHRGGHLKRQRKLEREMLKYLVWSCSRAGRRTKT